MEAPAGEPSPALTGASAFHFPVHWERAAWLPKGWHASELETALLETWRRLHDGPKPPLKYRVGGAEEPLETRPLGGELGLVAQRALGRAGKRKPSAVTSVAPAERDRTAFGFGDARWRELLFALEGPPVSPARPGPLPDVDPSAQLQPREGEAAAQMPGPHGVLVNFVPFCAFHFLLVPDLAQQLPQVLTLRSLELALSLGAHFSPFFRLTFNSLGAGASVNHLHWQGMYFREALPVERSPRKPFAALDGLVLDALERWPLPCWLFRCRSSEAGKLARAAWPLLERMLRESLAHNLCAVHEGGELRLLLFLRQMEGFMDPAQAQVAVMEVLGCWIVPSDKEYFSLTEEQAAKRMAAAAALAPAAHRAFVREALAGAGWAFAEEG